MKLGIYAHPDDELIWANPDDLDKIIICFADRLDSYKMFLGRKRTLKLLPYSNKIECLWLVESGYYPDKKNPEDFEKSKKEVREKLEEKIKELHPDEIFTHNPQTGEYGHDDHKMIGEIVSELAECPVYCLDISETAEDRLVEPNLKQYEKTRQIYMDNGCWTWYGDYYPRRTLHYKKIK